MRDEDRLHDVIRMLYEYSARPPLKFPSEAEIPKIARKILDAAYGPKSLWTKWDKDREEIIGRAVDVWVPMDDLLDALNTLPGEKLTATDVEQRLYALRNEHGGYSRGPDAAIKEASFTAYDEEKAKGTEFIAILGWLEEWTWGAEERLRRQRAEENRERIEQDKRRVEARLRSGADCPWTIAAGIVDIHCRKNGRLFRLKPLPKETSPLAPKFEVLEVKTLDDKRGTSIGRYRTRGDASKAILEVAYKPEWS
jgi:hypothetical protein